MASIDSIAAQLRQSLDRLHHAITAIRGAADTVGQLRSQFAALGARDLVHRIQAVAHGVTQLEQTLRASADATEGLIAQVEALRYGATTALGGTTPGLTLPDLDPSAPDPPPAMPLLAGADGFARVLATLPHRPGGEGATTGQLFTSSGHPAADGLLRSSRQPDLLADLDLPPRARLSDSMDSHVEAKAAKMIRDGTAPPHAILVINNQDGPCGWLRRQLAKRATSTTCDEWLADILPADTTLTLRWRDSDGVPRSQVYRGTERRIRR